MDDHSTDALTFSQSSVHGFREIGRYTGLSRTSVGVGLMCPIGGETCNTPGGQGTIVD